MRNRLSCVIALLIVSMTLVARGVDDPVIPPPVPSTPGAPTVQPVEPRRAPSPADAIAADKPAAAPGQKIYIIPIHGEINDMTAAFVKRCVEEAAGGGATTLVFDLETPGGGVMPALQISNLIKTRPIHTVAWVHSHAYSAGALISMACKQIVVTPQAAIGDCAPILLNERGELVPMPDTERDKQASPIRAEFRESAEANGYPINLALAMVSIGPAIYRVKDANSGAVRYLLATELNTYGVSTGAAPPAAAPTTSGPAAPAAPADPANPSTSAPRASPASPPAAPNVAHWVIEKKVLEEHQLLTMHAREAVEFGFAKAFVSDEAELAKFLHGELSDLHRFEPTWSEQLVPWLTSTPVRAVLIIVFLIAIFVEMSAPGLSGAGLVAVVALAILLGAPYLTGLAGVMDILLVLIGLILIAMEIFVLPGHLAFGITGLVLVFLGLVMTFVPKEAGPQWLPQTSGGWNAMETGALTVTAAVAVGAIGMVILSRFLPALPIFGRLVLQSTGPGEPLPAAAMSGNAPTGTSTVASAPMQTGVAEGDTETIRIGAIGRVTAGLRPVGRAEFEDQITHVVTRGEWIDAGGRVRIIAIEGNNVIVEKA